MTDPHVPDVALLNLGFLVALKEAIARDPVQACFQFRVHASDAALIRDLDFDTLQSLALGLHESLVTLRYTGQDLRDLLSTPRALRGIFASVRQMVEDPRCSPSASVHTNQLPHASG